MRVWLAPCRYLPHLGGVETATAGLARSLQIKGHQVLIVTHKHPLTLPDREVIDGVHIVRLRFDSPRRDARTTLKAVQSWRETQAVLDGLPTPDVIHLHGASSQTLPLTWFSRRSHVPMVVTTHGEVVADVHGLYQHSAFARFALRLAARSASAITAPSASAVRAAGAVVPALSSARVVPNGIDVDFWAQDRTPTSATHAAFAWGRLEAQKGIDLLVAAWPVVRSQMPDAKLFIAGDGTQEVALRAQNTPGITWLGPLKHDDIRARLRSCQVAVVPSRTEAFGLSALEALAAGRPVVHSDVPALRDLVDGNGWSFRQGDIGSLTETLVTALAADTRTVPSDAVQAYRWGVVTSAYLAMYYEATARFIGRPGGD